MTRRESREDNAETVVYSTRNDGIYSQNGHFVSLPDGWEFVPSGDPALTRRLKAAASDYWAVHRKLGSREFGIGLCVPQGLRDTILRQLEAERQTPEYQNKLAAGRKRREKEQREYVEDFEAAVFDFLGFDQNYRDMARNLAHVIAVFATPVGSGTVARTERIPIEERARAAVIAWMRHNTTDYDHRYIPRIAGKRREVRREIAHDSLKLLDSYRNGLPAPEECPLKQALEHVLANASETLPQAKVHARSTNSPSLGTTHGGKTSLLPAVEKHQGVSQETQDKHPSRPSKLSDNSFWTKTPAKPTPPPRPKLDGGDFWL